MSDGTNTVDKSAVGGVGGIQADKPGVTKVAKAAGTATKGKKVKPKTAKAVKGGKAVKDGKSTKTKKPTKTGKPIDAKKEVAEGCPYRPTSSYGQLWMLLFKHREKGISRSDFIKEGAKVTGKDEKHVTYDAAVVLSPKSPKEGGTAHPSANRAADHYWVERTPGGLLKLHRR